jgi:uncharacterized integral membrane protein (TIGR00697 family)
MRSNSKKIIQNTPKYLWFLILSYSMVIAMSNWFDARLVEIFGMAISPGTLIFPITFLLSDMITEVYGYKHARRAIWSAFLFNIIFICYGQLLTHLPSPSFSKDNVLFNRLLSINIFIIFGSFTSYIVSEPINSYILAKLKQKYRGKYIAIRFVLSTIISSFLDSLIFASIAFFRIYSAHDIIKIIIDIWLTKTVIEIIGLPFSIRLAKFLKKSERLDIYDYGTNFTPLSFEANYSTNNNKYKNGDL